MATAAQPDQALSIEVLLTRIRNRDQSALDELWTIVRGRVHGWVRSILGAVDPEDVAQCVLEKLWYRTPEWQDLPRFYGWIRRVSVNAALDNHPPGHETSAETEPPPIREKPDRRRYAAELICIALRDANSPHQTLCWLANAALGDSPLEIETERRTPLAVWLEALAKRCPGESVVSDGREWNRWLLPLRAAMRAPLDSAEYPNAAGLPVGQSSMETYELPPDRKKAANMITKWVHSVKRRLLTAVAVDLRAGRFPAEG